jgi:hypothetical protein
MKKFLLMAVVAAILAVISLSLCTLPGFGSIGVLYFGYICTLAVPGLIIAGFALNKKPKTEESK